VIHVPLQQVPTQTLAINLGGQNCQIELRTNGPAFAVTPLYFTLTVGGGSPVATTRICRNLQRLLLDSQYRGFEGDFVFVDSQGDTDPVYTGLDDRYRLYWLAPTDLPTS
jgi:hypothetical protein